MRSFVIRLTALGILLGALVPAATANDSKPVSGTLLPLNVGEWTSVTIGGFGGCKFEVEATSDDEKVATVEFKVDTQAKKHKVMVTGEGVGMTMITVSTKNGTVPGCQGFDFTFPVQVTPDKKLFLKDSKKALKDAGKAASSMFNDEVKLYCTAVDDVLALVKSGEFTFDELIDVISLDWSFVTRALDAKRNQALDDAFAAVWNTPNAMGFTTLDDDMLSYLPGGCGEWDKFEEGLEKQADKAAKKIRAKLKKAIKQVNKAAKEVEAVVLLLNQLFFAPPGLSVPLPLPADPAQMPAPPVPKPLRKTAVSSGRLSSAGVTRLDISGIGDEEGGQVTVSITGPDGFNDSEMLDLDDDCGFRASFTGIKPGHYTVTLSQNGVTTTFTTVAA